MSSIPNRLRTQLKPFALRHTGFIGSTVAVQTSSPTVVLTYDDGPEPGGTDRILTALADARATATFFVLMTRVRRFPALLNDVVGQGHEIALHGPDHRALVNFNRQEVISRTLQAKSELESQIQQPVRWIRPPYGKQTPKTWAALRVTGLEPVMWSGTNWDSRSDVTDADRIAKLTTDLKAGAIILAHDGIAVAEDGADDGPPPVVDRGRLTEAMLAEFGSRGLVARSLQDALTNGSRVKRVWFGS